MRNFKLLILIIVFIVGGYIFIRETVFACFDDSKKLGNPKSSESLKFSRENQLLIQRVRFNKDRIRLNDSSHLQIEEAWVENGWEYQCVDNRITIIKNNSIQLIIKLKNNSWFKQMDFYSAEMGNAMAGSDNDNMIFDADRTESSIIEIFKLKNKYEFKGEKTVVDSLKIITSANNG